MNFDERLPFFVYGTLLPKQPNAYLWRDVEARVETAVIRQAHLYDLGHYPMMVEADTGQVKGALLFIDGSAYDEIAATYNEVAGRFDHLEGFDPSRPNQGAYRRVERAVEGEDGRLHSAWVYLGQPRYVRGRPFIESGDWAAYVEPKKSSSNVWWRGINSVAGLHDE